MPDIEEAKEACRLAVIAKDFILNKIQM